MKGGRWKIEDRNAFSEFFFKFGGKGSVSPRL